MTDRFGDIRRHGDVDSTNRVAIDLARSGAPEGLVVVADHQTAGRGRRGRSWEEPPGSSLLVSVLLRPPPVAELLGLATMACALAAADACTDVAEFEPGLKWPNDLVVGERKLAGVLAERVAGAGGAPAAVVVGLGLNVGWGDLAPIALRERAVTAEEVAGRPVDRGTLLGAYLARLDIRLFWRANRPGFPPDSHARTVEEPEVAAVLRDYRRRCVTLGRALHLELPGGRSCDGIATGVDDDGSLLVASGGSIRRVTAGEVVHVLPGG